MKPSKLTMNRKMLQDRMSEILPGLRIKNFRTEAQIEDIKVDSLLVGELKGKRYTFVCEAKSLGSPSHILPVVAKLSKVAKDKRSYPIIIAPYISERSAEICRRSGVGFIDSEGNAFLSLGNILVDKRVKERVNIEKREKLEIFSPRAVRVIRVLLESKKERWLITALAQEANVSLGYTSEVLRGLANQGYVNGEKRRGFQLKDKTALLDRWASVYDFSQNKLMSLYTLEKNFGALFKKISETSDSLGLRCGMTLLSAASVVAPYVARFADIYLYVEGDTARWKKELDLRDVEAGANFYLITPYDEGVFYRLRKVKGIPVIGNIQLYLDLIRYPARGKEQAKYLREKLIGF